MDYKSTSQKLKGKKINLEGPWKVAYKRQMDFYVWVIERIGLEVSQIRYFLHVDGDRFTDQLFLNETTATVNFKVTLIPYETDCSWFEKALFAIKETLLKKKRPTHNPSCEFGEFLQSA